MAIPFSVDAFMAVFTRYNTAIGVTPLLLVALAALTVALAWRGSPTASRATAGLLAAQWVWTGAVYHLAFFTRINPAAYAFGGVFLLQGALLLGVGVFGDRLRFGPPRGVSGAIGGLLVLYALAIYPLLNILLGHDYPAMPTFGAPCPTTIFTIGLLLWLRPLSPRYMLAVPVVWAAIGGTAAFTLGIAEDLGLVAAGFAAVALMVTQSLSGSGKQ